MAANSKLTEDVRAMIAEAQAGLASVVEQLGDLLADEQAATLAD